MEKKVKKMSLHFYLSLKRRSKTWNCCAGKGWFISKSTDSSVTVHVMSLSEEEFMLR